MLRLVGVLMGAVPPIGDLGLLLGGDERKWSVSPDRSVSIKDSDTAAKNGN